MAIQRSEIIPEKVVSHISQKAPMKQGYSSANRSFCFRNLKVM
jgi:hypothetical protein